MYQTVLLIFVVAACLWTWQRLREQERNRAALFEDPTGDAVLALSKKGRIDSIGPKAKRIFGFEGRVDPLMLSDIPVDGFLPWLSRIEAKKQPGDLTGLVNTELQLELAHSRSAVNGQSSARILARLAPLPPKLGVYPALVSFQLLDSSERLEASSAKDAGLDSGTQQMDESMDLQTCHDPDYLDAAADFLTDLDRSAQQLQRSIESEDWGNVEYLATKLRSAADAFGLPEISESATVLVGVASVEKDRSAADREMRRLYDLVCGVSGHVLIDDVAHED